MRSARTRALCIVTAALVATRSAGGDESSASPPNVILIVADEWPDPGPSGRAPIATPNVDRLAAEGMRFEQAYSAGAGAESLAALLTGRWPARTALASFERLPDRALETPQSGSYLPPAETTLAEALAARGYATAFAGEWRLGSGEQGPAAQGFQVHRRETTDAVEFLRERRDRQFLLCLSEATMEGLDRAAGIVLAEVASLALDERTLIVFTSDGAPHESGARVPLIARFRGTIPQARVSATPVCGVDLVPTVLDLAGVVPEGPLALDGVSLAVHLRSGGETPLAREALFWHSPRYRESNGPFSAVRAGSLKLIRWWEPERDELYDLEADPGATTDLAAAKRDDVFDLQRRLDIHLVETGALLPRTPAPPPRTSYLGREIAPVMSSDGAGWLIRESREAEENTSLLLASLGVKPGDVVCDFGCGNGYHAIPLAGLVAKDGRILAVDVQRPMLAMLIERAAGSGATNIDPILAEPHDPRLPPASCDLILMVDVYHELSHPPEVLAELRRALAPGGRLALVEFRAEDPSVPILPLHKMSKEQMHRELSANGFRVAREFDLLPWQHLVLYEADAEWDGRDR